MGTSAFGGERSEDRKGKGEEIEPGLIQLSFEIC
jgi:hypothetical protein